MSEVCRNPRGMSSKQIMAYIELQQYWKDQPEEYKDQLISKISVFIVIYMKKLSIIQYNKDEYY